jgi:Fe-S-cluster containining protein
MCGECCRRYAIPVTPADIHQIKKRTGLDPTAFLTLMEPDNSVIKTYEDYPKIRLEDGDNFVLVLSQQDDGCMFLMDNRCSIYQARPMVCVPFPFQYSLEKAGRIGFSVNEEANTFCRGLGKGTRDPNFTELRRSAIDIESQNKAFRGKVQKWNKKASNRDTNSSEIAVLIDFLTRDIN